MKLRPDTLLVLGGLAAVGFVLYKTFDIGKDAADKASTSIANLWLKLFPMPEAMQLFGNVKFPGNLLVSLQTIASDPKGGVRQDSNHNVFVRYAGYTWQLAPQVNGNWPATRID